MSYAAASPRRSWPKDAAELADLPVARPYMPPAEAVLPYLRQMDEARWYANFGPLLNAFEQRLRSRFTSATTLATVVNATQGLTLALKAMELGPGLCALPSWTFVATAHAVIAAGLTPWFVDVDAASWMLAPDMLREQLAEAPGPVRAVVPVGAFGQVPDLAAWRAFRDATGTAVLIDAAASFDAVREASLPLVVSLHATKALGVGEGGFVASDDPGFIDRVRELTTYGFRGSRESHVAATNAKLSEYACAVGLASLDRWPATRLRYMSVAQRLRMALTAAPEVSFQPGWGGAWISSTCVVGVPDGSADAIAAHLLSLGLQTRRWWGEGCHLSPAFAGAPQTRLPATQRLASSTLGLPYFADMSAIEIERVAQALAEAVQVRLP